MTPDPVDDVDDPLIGPPAARPCPSCPYRRDVPSAVWAPEEYDRLPAFDGPTWTQPPGVFLCHQVTGAVCAGWAGCHDMVESLGLRLAVARGDMSIETYDATVDYLSPVPLFSSGAEAAEHGRAELEWPSPQALELGRRIVRKQRRSDQG